MPDIPDTRKRNTQEGSDPAVDLIRQKLDKLYSNEPNAAEEAAESNLTTHRSKYQNFMHDLSTSGKPISEIQTAWHNYYVGLTNKEKHEVWQEFYSAQNQKSALFKATPQQVSQTQQGTPMVEISTNTTETAHTKLPKAPSKSASISELKKQITGKVRVRGKLTRKQHLKSLGFGLSMGTLVVIVLLFGFFNERFIAPFITPSKTVSATPLILDPNNNAVDPTPQIIIPKINAQGPVVYDVPSISEDDVQSGLERGIVHYPTTPNPGELGNAVFFGHSSGNILNRGKYKFIFVLLNWMEVGDTFYIQKDGVRYVYKVFEKRVVKPSDVSVLDPIAGKPSTATLITCDPPGTNVNRLIVIGEQISPDPVKNVASSVKENATPDVLAGNSESLWSRLVNYIF